MSIRSYRDLEVWQKAMRLVVESYHLTKRFPLDERFALTLEVRRAAVSVPSNIAEGHERWSTREFLKHLSIARGSLGELDTDLELGVLLEYVSRGQLAPTYRLIDDVSRTISRLRQSLAPRARKRFSRPAPRSPRLAPRLPPPS